MSTGDSLKGKRVIIVDDEPDVLDTLEDMLEMCEVVRASSFEQAKELLEKESFDLAILDIMGVNGYGLLRIANEKKIPAVMLTAHALSPEDIVKSYRQGAASYVPKDQIAQIPAFLLDILEAERLGKHFWWRWLERLGNAYWDKKFGSRWREKEKDFWENFEVKTKK